MAPRGRRSAAFPARRPRAFAHTRCEHVLVQRTRTGFRRVPGDQPRHCWIDDEWHEEQEYHERQECRGAQAQAHFRLNALAETVFSWFAE